MNLIERAVARLGGANLQQSVPEVGLGDGDPKPTGPRVSKAGSDENVNYIAFNGKGDSPDGTSKLQRFGPSVDLHLESLRDKGFLTPAARATATGHEFRLIKGPVLEKAFGTDAQRVAGGQRVVVTSALPGEGKTFCAINLAISIAATGDRPVLLIDADIARPSIASHLGIESSKGLIDILKGDVPDPLSVALPTNINRLSVMPAGTSQPHASEYLGGQKLGAFLDLLAADLPDWLIIIDTPPLLAVTEIRSLVQRVGQVILVIAAGETPRKSVEAALSTIANAGNVSVILNKVPESKARLDYYYGY